MVVRSKERRYGTALATAATAVVLLAACGVVTQEPAAPTVVIAADLELTGGGSALGAVYEDALRLRVAQVNQQGLLGNRQLELRVSDNRSDSATARTNVTEFAADPEVTAIVMGGCDQCAVASVDVINDGRIPTIALAAASAITEPVAERAYMFQIGPRAGDSARLLADELRSDGVETVALVAVNDLYGEEGQTNMQAAAERAGVDVVVAETVSADEERVAAAAATIVAYQPPVDPLVQGLQDPEPAQTGPDAVVIWAPGYMASQLALSLREQEYEGRFYLAPSAADELFLSGPAAALEDAKMAFTETLVIDGVIATSPAKAARRTWFNDYTARVGTYHAYSSFAADAVQVIVEAVNQAGSTDRDALRSEIENLQLDGFSGPIRFRLETHSGLNPLALITLVAQGDRWRVAAA